eukprot:scaffold166955_cov57-Cyclotella_meneghiniana.AAC.1
METEEENDDPPSQRSNLLARLSKAKKSQVVDPSNEASPNKPPSNGTKKASPKKPPSKGTSSKKNYKSPSKLKAVSKPSPKEVSKSSSKNQRRSTGVKKQNEGFHCCEPYFHPQLTNNGIMQYQNIDMVDRIQGPLNNQFYYTNYVGNQDIAAMWQPTATANLDEPPYQYISTPIYQGCTPNFEVQPKISILRDRLHPQRWDNTIEWHCHNIYQMPYNGMKNVAKSTVAHNAAAASASPTSS